MATPIFYQTLNMVGVDPTLYYTNLATAGGSITPDYPAPPFIVGTRAFGSDGSEFIFVQASTSISLTDFVVINAGNTPNPFMANSISESNQLSTTAPLANIALGATGLVLKGSLSFIPAGAMFWACTKGNFIPATTSTGNLATGNVALFTTPTAGQLTTTASISAIAFAGIQVISSVSVSIAGSLVPAGIGATQSNGFTVGPVVTLNNPRVVNVATTAGVASTALAYW